MDFISKELDDYVGNHTQKEPEWLYELNRETHLNVIHPRMLSGHFQGRVLSMISKMIQPTDVLEIGTYTGYSALCMAEGLADGGHIVTIDYNEELADMVQRYIKKSPYEDKIKCVISDAMEVIPGLKKFMKTYVNKKTMGKRGYLTDLGLVPLDAETFKAMQTRVKSIK